MKDDNGHYLATMPIHLAFVDDKAYLVSIGQTKMKTRKSNKNSIIAQDSTK